MPDSGSCAGRHQRMTGDRVVVVVAKWIGYRFRYDDAAGKVEDGRDSPGEGNLHDERFITGTAKDERHVSRDGGGGAVGQIVEDHDRMPCRPQGQDGVASDVTRSAGDQYRPVRAHASSATRLKHYGSLHSVNRV